MEKVGKNEKSKNLKILESESLVFLSFSLSLQLCKLLQSSSTEFNSVNFHNSVLYSVKLKTPGTIVGLRRLFILKVMNF